MTGVSRPHSNVVVPLRGRAPEPRRDTALFALTAQPEWPIPLANEAFYGLAGEIVRAIEPHTETDNAGLLVQLIVAFGNLIGPCIHFVAEADKHYSNLFAVLVGRTAKSRKGTSWGIISRLLGEVDPEWSQNHVTSGCSSGEGLIWAVRDPIETRDPVREKGRITGYQNIVSDEGVPDKRLMVQEPEFARVLQVAERETNVLSAVIRQAWDTGKLNTLTKNKAASATGAHISIVGHITRDELLRTLSDTAAANGFANRFLWVCVTRSKLLPEGGAFHTVDNRPYVERLQQARKFAGQAGELRRDEESRAIWRSIYPELSAGQLGMFGAVTSRAEAQTMRLACVYAALDCSSVIRAEHLAAALAVWKYCDDSARFIFGDSLGDATADEILSVLRAHPAGLTRSEIRNYFQRHKRSVEIDRSLTVLRQTGLAKETLEQTGGRPSERWIAIANAR